jgi:hypothetical protein
MLFRLSHRMRKTNIAIGASFLFIVYVSVMFSCCIRTEGTLKIRGRVFDESTKEGVPWKNIVVQGLTENNNKLEPIESGQFSTDSTGSFSYSLKKIKGAYDYNFCFPGGTEYPGSIKTISLTDLKSNAKFLFFPMGKLVDLTIKINRKSKSPLCDTLRLIWDSDGIYGGSLYPYKINNYGRTINYIGNPSDADLIWIGGKVNSIVNTKVFVGKKTTLTWELYRYGRRKVFIDTLTCKKDFANVVYFKY